MSTPLRILTSMCLLAILATAPADDTLTTSSVPSMREASVAFLNALSPDLREQVSFSVDDDEREAWSNFPYPMYQREGVSFGEMSAPQRHAAHKLLQSALSSSGYLKATGIMHLDEILKAVVDVPPDVPVEFGYDNYWISLFGNPADDAAWGWQLDGHHLALNIAVVGDAVSVRPAFFGSDPAAWPDGMFSGWEILYEEDGKAKRLLESLDTEQRETAIIAHASPKDLITGPENAGRIDELEGLPASAMTASQQRLLKQLIGEYVHNYRHDIAHAQMKRIMSTGIDDIHFAWAGTGDAEPYYYRIHGPRVLIEFTNMYPPGQSSGPINHIHSIFRDPGNDYGEDLLRKHLEESPHHQSSDR